MRRIDGSNNTKTEACSLDKGSVLMQEYIELRGELKQRISQMDSCCTQCVVFMAAMITAAFSTKKCLDYVTDTCCNGFLLLADF